MIRVPNVILSCLTLLPRAGLTAIQAGKTACAIIVALLAMATFSGCSSPQEDNVIFRYRQMPDNSWDRQDSIIFNIDSVSHSGLYRLSVALRTTSEVPFQSVAVVVEEDLRRPHFYRKDTVNVVLTDRRGNIEGNGLVLHNYLMPDAKVIRLRRGQRGRVKVSHIMRRMQLDGIRDIGVRIQRIEHQE